MSHRFKKRTAATSAMYRHFAVVTVVCTALLAMFADDGTSAAAGHQAPDPAKEQATPEAPEAQQLAQVQQPRGVWGSEDGGSFGSSSFAPARPFSSMASGLQAGIFGRQPPDYLARLSVSEREALLKAIADNGSDGSSLASARKASLEDASRRRSGSLGIE